MVLTYKQILSILESYATNHYQINEFGAGDKLWEAIEHNQLKDFNYPLMWVDTQPASTEQGLWNYTFRIFFMSLVQKDESNEDEVLSDMQLLCADILAWWKMQVDYLQITMDVNTNATPFTESTNDELSGWWIDIKLNVPMRYNKCEIPMDGLTPLGSSCASATETFNGNSITAIPSGGSKAIIVQNDAGSPAQVGTILVDNASALTIEVPAAGGVVANSMNGTGLTDAAAGTTKTFTITYADSSPVVVTTTADSATAFTGTVPNITTPLNTSNHYKTGQTTSYRTGDNPTVGRGSSWLVLDHLNGFGANTNRFTDQSGGQTYTDDIIVDWAFWDQVNGTVPMWYRIPTATSTWDNAIDGAVASTVGGYSDWYLNKMIELLSVCEYETSGADLILLNYAPFNINITAQGERLWCADRAESGRYQTLIENGNFQAQNSTSNQSYIYTRVGLLTDMGL